MKYRVTLCQAVYQRATLELEASSEIEAAIMARVIYNDGPTLDWVIDDCDDVDIDAEEIGG